MRQFAFYHHVGSGNKGCEALVRSTSALLHDQFGQADIRLFSQRPQEDLHSRYPFVNDVLAAETNRPISVTDRIRLKLLKNKSALDADLYYFAGRMPEEIDDPDRV